MGIKDCLLKITDASKGRLSPEEAENLLKDMERNREAYIEKNGDMDYKNMSELEKKNLMEKRKAYFTERYNRLKNFGIRENLLDGLKNNMKDPVGYLLRQINASDADKIHTRNKVNADYLSKLRKEGVYDFRRNKMYTDEVAEELYSIQSRNSFDDPIPESITGNKEAHKVAIVMNDIYEKTMVQGYRDEGADLNTIKQYVAEQNYNPDRISDVSKEEFINDFLEHLDTERTFRETFNGKVPTPEELEDIYYALATGIHNQDAGVRNLVIDPKTGKMVNADELVDPVTKFKGPGNIAKGLQQHRKFFFKPGKNNAFFTKYGNGDIYDRFDMMITKYANNKSVMRNFGNNPESMIKTVQDDFALATRKELGSAGGHPIYDDWITKSVNKILGKLDVLEPTPKAKVIDTIDQTTRKANVINFLQNVSASALGDKFLTHKEFQEMGMGYFESVGTILNDMARSLMDNFSEGDRHLVDMFVDYQEAMTGSTQDMYRFSGSSVSNAGESFAYVPSDFNIKHRGLKRWVDDMADRAKLLGKATFDDYYKKGFGRAFVTGVDKLADMSMEMSMLPHLDRNSRVNFNKAFSKMIGKFSNKDFNALPDSFKRYLNDYEMSDIWDTVRGSVESTKDGTKFLPIDWADKIPDDFFKAKDPNMSKAEIRRARLDLDLAVGRALTNSRDRAIPTPRAVEQAVTSLGTKRGTIGYVAMQQFLQFKSYPIALWNRVFGEDIRRGGRNVEMSAAMAHLFIGGLAVISLKAALDGEVIDYTKPQSYVRAALQGIGFPFADVFIKPSDNFVGFNLTFDALGILGPTVGRIPKTIEAGGSLMQAIIEGDPEKLAKPVKYGYQLLPFTKLPYTRFATSFLMYDPIMKSINSDYAVAQDKHANDLAQIPMSDLIGGPENIGELVTGNY